MITTQRLDHKKNKVFGLSYHNGIILTIPDFANMDKIKDCKKHQSAFI